EPHARYFGSALQLSVRAPPRREGVFWTDGLLRRSKGPFLPPLRDPRESGRARARRASARLGAAPYCYVPRPNRGGCQRGRAVRGGLAEVRLTARSRNPAFSFAA